MLATFRELVEQVLSRSHCGTTIHALQYQLVCAEAPRACCPVGSPGALLPMFSVYHTCISSIVRTMARPATFGSWRKSWYQGNAFRQLPCLLCVGLLLMCMMHLFLLGSS